MMFEMSKPTRPKWDPSVLKGLNLVQLNPGTTCYPWDITPLAYLEFAREEMTHDGSRSGINAVSHSKRAIHAHVDFLLHNCGRFLRDANFPTKLELLHRLGIVAPTILTKYNRIRNLMEHEYTAPSKEQVEEVADVAELFLKATLNYTRLLPASLVFLPADGQGALTMDCSWDDKQITIVASGERMPAWGACVIDSGDGDLWLAWVAQILTVMQDRDNFYKRCKDAH